ncbi:MAG TPA: glutathione transferase [Polyangiales bacterium]|jgi:glutathione S-transferase
MQPIVLYGNKPLTSPYVFSVFVALEEKGLPFELRTLSLETGEQLAPEFVARSITNRVPMLTHGAFAIAESSAITEYLEDRFAPPEYARLYPEDPEQRARVRMVQALVRSDFEAIRAERSTATVFGQASPGALSVAAIAQVERLCRIAGQLVSGADATIAGSFSIADVDLALMLQRLLANQDPMPQPLAAYASAIWQRPSVQAFHARLRAS